ncbi:lasso peptide biosynthesis B2 protein [Nocardioides sp. CPCC 206347]|uniref:lasso peptide biosynthesis B2 protein n=1 Tax=Nocardioides sp. CPCC 206347 TaxID=3406463 RepID=UPI003B4301E9
MLAAAWTLLGLTRLLTVVLPFRAIRHLLGEHRSPNGANPASGPVPPPADARDENRARQIGWAVRTAAHRTPWRSDCYPQALTARVLLRLARVPHAVTFGVRRDDAGTLKAHAWVSAGRVAVAGGTGHSWVGVGNFTWSPRGR